MATLALSPVTVPLYGTGVLIGLTGTGTAWSAGTPGIPTFALAGGNGAAITGQQVFDGVTASINVDAGASPGGLYIVDPSTGAQAILLVVPPSGITQPRFTYDITTPIGQMRMEIGDWDFSQVAGPKETWSALYSDQELQQLYERFDNSPELAAAYALRSMASRPEMLVRRIRILNLDLDVGDLGKALNDRANQLLMGAANTPQEAYAEQAVTDAATRRIIWNAILRKFGA